MNEALMFVATGPCSILFDFYLFQEFNESSSNGSSHQNMSKFIFFFTLKGRERITKNTQTFTCLNMLVLNS